MSHIDSTLAERGTRYGDFASQAEITQGLKDVMTNTPNWNRLADDQKEALAMTAHKIGRILNGDPDYIDSWHDIIGYVRLVEQRLEMREKTNAQNEQIVVAPQHPEQSGQVSVANFINHLRECGFGGEINIVIVEEDSGEA